MPYKGGLLAWLVAVLILLHLCCGEGNALDGGGGDGCDQWPLPPRSAMIFYNNDTLASAVWMHKHHLELLEMGFHPRLCPGASVSSLLITDGNGKAIDEIPSREMHSSLHSSSARRRRLMGGEGEANEGLWSLERWPNKILEYNNILLAVLPNDGFDHHVMELHKWRDENCYNPPCGGGVCPTTFTALRINCFLPLFFTHYDLQSGFLRQMGAVSGGMGKMTHPAYYMINREDATKKEWRWRKIDQISSW